MAEQIILNTDLYDNLLTERKGDYTAKPRITGTLYNTDIAARIVAARTEYQHGTILNILDMADSHKVQAIAEGKSVVDGVGKYLVNVQGAFEGEKAQFEPGKHALGITYTMGKLLRETLKLVKVVVNSVPITGVSSARRLAKPQNTPSGRSVEVGSNVGPTQTVGSCTFMKSSMLLYLDRVS